MTYKNVDLGLAGLCEEDDGVTDALLEDILFVERGGEGGAQQRPGP